MQSGAGNLPARPETRKRAASIPIYRDAAHVVMRGRTHRDGLCGGINTSFSAGNGDRRKMPIETVPKRPTSIQEDAVPFAQMPPYRACDDIAGREFAPLHACHETRASFIDQRRAFASYRLTHQHEWMTAGIERRWVELHELHVNQDSPGTSGKREALTQRSAWVRGMQEQARQCHRSPGSPGWLAASQRRNTMQPGCR